MTATASPPAAHGAPPTVPHSAERWAVVLPHRDRLVRLAIRKLGDPHDAEDCVHETLLRTVSFTGLDERRVGAFLTTVTVRLCADRHRATARARSAAHRLWAGEEYDGPEQQICDRLGAEWLRGQLGHLSERERAVIEARAAGLSTKEAALSLGITLKAAESAFTRARTKMASYAENVA